MARPTYDDPDFFAAYAELPRSVGGLAAAPEWPSLQAMLPDIRGARVLDLGCGYGWFCRWATEAGAASVVGVDASERMLATARDRSLAGTDHDRIEYRRLDLDAPHEPFLDALLGGRTVDVAYSSLTLHYLERLDEVLAAVAGVLAPGGRLVCSVEHPVYTAPVEREFVTLADGRRVWPVDHYLDEGERATVWLGATVVKQHRTIGTYLRLLGANGFDLVDLVEWGPSPEEVAARPDWAGERDRPSFLLISAAPR